MAFNINKGVVFLLKRKLIPISVGISLVFGLVACSGNDEVQEGNPQVEVGTEAPAEDGENTLNLEQSEPVAIVNGEEILQHELNNQLEQVKMSYQQQGMEIEGENEIQIKKQILDQLVNTVLISQVANEEGFTPSEDEVETQIEEIKVQYGSEEKFTEVLEQNNLNLDRLKEELIKELAISKYLESNIETSTVSKDEIAERYEQYKQQTEEMPELEEVETQLEEEIKNEKNQASIGELVNKLKEKSEIEILI